MPRLQLLRPDHAPALLEFARPPRRRGGGGRGLATTAVHEVCALAAAEYGPDTLRAVTTLDNPASPAVLTRTRFVPVGELRLDGRPGVRFERKLRGVPGPGA